MKKLPPLADDQITLTFRPMSEHPADGTECIFEMLDHLKEPQYRLDLGKWSEDDECFYGPGQAWRVKSNSVKRWAEAE
jgi:hypothetical protein